MSWMYPLRRQRLWHHNPRKVCPDQSWQTLSCAILCSFILGYLSPTAQAEQAAAPKTKPSAATSSITPKTKMALKLAGLVSFVASSCHDLRPDYAKFKGALAALGVSYSDLETKELKSEYLSYALRYKENATSSCARALTDFGPNGKVIADLLKPQIDDRGLSRKSD